MKSNITYLFAIAFFCSCTVINSQTLVDGGEYKFNESKLPCLTNLQREAVMAELRSGIQSLSLQNRLAYNNANRGSNPLFSWPIKKKNGLDYNDVWGISNYVDQNTAFPNQVLDYNCGSRTYDTTSGYNHLGMDIYLWPFSWKMMDNDEVEIIAAAPGQIISKATNNPDRSCALNGGNWNAVYVQHSDGSVALYGHMKQFSPTTKNVGDMVVEGEYLGIVGSSGNSSGPHLHFETYSEIEWNGVGQDILVDPYAGSCNSLNTDSWWQNQKPYNNPNINAALTHSAAPVFPACPTQEITNESNAFETGATIYVAAYLRDQAAGTSLDLKILRPDGSTFLTWNFNLTANYYSSYWYWTVSPPSIPGNWTWQINYLGQTVNHSFTVGTLGVSEENLNSTSIYPNPFNDIVTIASSNKIQKATVTDVLGKTISVINNNSSDGIKEVNLEKLSNGIYFLTLESDANQKKTIKLIKE